MKKLFILLNVILITNSMKAQWSQTTGPNLTSSYVALEVSKIAPSGDKICAIINNQVHLSKNNGLSWMNASYGLNGPVSAIAFSDSTIFAGVGGLGLFMSKNYGSTYHSVNGNLPNLIWVNDIFIGDNLVIVSVSATDASVNEVYYSTNNGDSWNLSSGLSNELVYCFASNGVKLYAGTSNGVYYSTDSGLNWNIIGLTYSYSIEGIAVDGNRIFASENTSDGGVYFSSDNGANWSVVKSGGIKSIAIDGNYVYAASSWNGVYRSSNNGADWTLINNGYFNYPNTKALVVSGNNLYAGGSEGFAISTNHGSSWDCRLKTFNLHINSIVSCGGNIAAAADNRINKSLYFTTDGGLNWSNYLVKTNTLSTNGSVIFSGSDVSMSKYDNCGNNRIDTYGIPNDPIIKSITTNASSAIAGLYGQGIYFSQDNGIHWTEKNNGLTSLNINSVAMNNNIFVAGTENNGVFISNDNGLNWVPMNYGILDTCIQAVLIVENNIYAGTKNHGLYKSIDNGNNWVQVLISSIDTNILSLYSDGMNVYAGVLGRGLFVSHDNSSNWTSYNTDLLSFNIYSITKDNANLYIGTNGGIWQRPISQFLSTNNLLSDCQFSIYPNPSSNNVYIEALQSSNVINLKLYDINGKELINKQIIGNKKMIDISQFSNGIYFLKLSSNKFSEIKKIIKE